MSKKISIIVFSLFAILFMNSCIEAMNETNKVIEKSKKPELIGKYFPIESQGIKLFLPKEFKSLSKADYLEMVEKSEDSTIISYENQRLQNLYRTGHDLYLFQHLESGSILSLIPTKYIKFNKSDAQMLLNQIRANHDEITAKTRVYYDKKEARFFETKDAQIFKAIYEISAAKMETEFYKQIYFVSFNNKSFALTLETGLPVDFDPYLDKIRVL